MKKLEELGISKYPWSFCKHIEKVRCVVRNLLGKIIVGYTNIPNARLIAAAPNMYQKAYELIEAFDRREMKPEHINALRAALANAAGEEMEND